ncbi:MAG: ABC transporter ATP-binding protein, partial [Ketobacter sp.]
GYYGLDKRTAAERAEKYLKLLDLWDKRDESARMLSGGMKRRLMIARALVHEPKLLILDEPTAGVDIELRRSMWGFLEQLNASGTTIILTTHYLEEAEHLCRTIAIIDQGQIIHQGSMKKFLAGLDKETFILDLERDITDVPKIEAVSVGLIDSHTLQVEVSKQEPLNKVFSELTSLGINVVSMRNKANRLEELFVSLVESKR